MTIQVKGKSPVKYRVVCTDKACANILEFDSTDVKHQSASCMGHRVDRGQGISCPDCAQIMLVKEFKVIK